MKHEIFKKNKNIIESKEIVFSDFENLILDENRKKVMRINSGKIRVIEFKYFVNKLTVTGYLAFPKNLNFNKKNITAICLRGGNNIFGAIKPGMFFNNESYFSLLPLNGFVTFYTQYRGGGSGNGKDEFGGKDLNDVKALYKIISKLNFCNSENIVALGWSRGAQMIYQLLKSENWIKRAICIAGPTNHFKMMEFRLDWRGHLIQMFGGSFTEIKKRSAIFWTNKIKKIPILIVHGEKDEMVPVSESEELHKHLINSKLLIFKSDNHSLKKNFNKLKNLVSFLR